LHIDYHYETIPVAFLLSTPAPEQSRPRALSSPHERAAAAAAPKSSFTQQRRKTDEELEEEVVVLDCRGPSDLELLARAWCAKVGEHAIVGKSGRTCVACCVREARALGVGVVIRV